jgi:hypothetical protein
VFADTGSMSPVAVLDDDRGARLAAGADAVTVDLVAGNAVTVDAPALDAATDAETTLPIRLLRAGAANTSLVAGAMRGLIATPWFAAATGFVVAAGLWIYSPHAELKFPVSSPNTQPCAPRACAIANGSGSTATNGQHVGQGGGTSAATSASRAASVVRRLKFTYQVLSNSDGRFAVRITVTGRRPPRDWKLALAMPGDQIVGVLGAAWDPTSDASGIASRPTNPAGTQWQGTAGPSPQIPPRRGFTFVLYGQGTPTAPTGCRLNGVRCKFSQAPPS